MPDYRRGIFLDIDGVLISHESYLPPYKQEGKPAQPTPLTVAALNHIIRVTGAAIVISSTWRLNQSRVQLQELLKGWGVYGVVIGKTPHLVSSVGAVYVAKARGEEIQAWLDEWAEWRDPTESFVILDDESDMAHLNDRLVKTRFVEGLTMADADRAIALLNQPIQRGTLS